MSGDSDRIEFVGHVAPDYIKNCFIGKMIPEKYRVKGLASPFLYKKLVEDEPTIKINFPIEEPVQNPAPAPEVEKKLSLWERIVKFFEK